MVEFDPASQWYNASVNIAAGWLGTEGTVDYIVTVQPPDNIRSQLNKLGLDVKELEARNKLIIRDSYTVSLGQKSKEKYATASLKVAELSIELSKLLKDPPKEPHHLTIVDDESSLARFNDEKAWVEWVLTRAFPRATLRKEISIRGIIRGVHSDWVYKRLEASADGIIDFHLNERNKATVELMRIRSMRNVAYDKEWHQLKVGENFEVTFEK